MYPLFGHRKIHALVFGDSGDARARSYRAAGLVIDYLEAVNAGTSHAVNDRRRRAHAGERHSAVFGLNIAGKYLKHTSDGNINGIADILARNDIKHTAAHAVGVGAKATRTVYPVPAAVISDCRKASKPPRMRAADRTSTASAAAAMIDLTAIPDARNELSFFSIYMTPDNIIYHSNYIKYGTNVQ